MTVSDPLAPPSERLAELQPLLERLRAARRVVLTTHVNADGDGVGSEVAVASWLRGWGIAAMIVNPTRFPAPLRFLARADWVSDWGEPEASRVVAGADLFLVLDTSEPGRLGEVAERLPRDRTLVLDHHPPGAASAGALALRDPSAAATGELVWDLLTLAEAPLTPDIALALYVALVSDTGSFRYANTTPRVHAIAARLLQHGVDPERVYRQLFATVPLRRLELLREALATVQVDADLPLSWISISRDVAHRTGATGDDFDGLVEHARSLEGTQVAILFRETEDRRTKMSFRSNGDADVNRLARQFGGGGHVKAAGAMVPEPLERVRPRVLEAARALLRLSL